MPHPKSKNVALVLASGGAKGYAHIGAIEALQDRGYNIKSVTGCSMGSLVGGMYAAGKLNEARDLMLSVDFKKYFSLLDLNFSLLDLNICRTGLLKGEKIIELLREMAPDSQIGSLTTPFRAVATDITHARETLFTSGDLFDAIRASISIPGVFRPMRIGDSEFIDGGVMDPLPLSHAPRTHGDILVAVDINAHPDPAYNKTSIPQKLTALFDTVSTKMDTVPQLQDNVWVQNLLGSA
ncbi:patatin-like phospholipase family protein, partial [Salmonella enterica]|nr:patatin-like phospholipase family protein [Salmonella enterica]